MFLLLVLLLDLEMIKFWWTPKSQKDFQRRALLMNQELLAIYAGIAVSIYPGAYLRFR